MFPFALRLINYIANLSMYPLSTVSCITRVDILAIIIDIMILLDTATLSHSCTSEVGIAIGAIIVPECLIITVIIVIVVVYWWR